MKKLLIISLSILILAGCGEPKKKESDNRTVFRYNEAYSISSLDPAFARTSENIWGVNQVFNGLVQMNDKLEVEPCIAKSWEIEDSGTVYIFHLRSDVNFHDHQLFPNGKGRKVVARDFVNSFYRITSKDVASPGVWIFNNLDKSLKSNYLGFSAPDDSTFIVYLEKQFPPFLGLLSMQYCSVVPFEIVDYYGNDFRNNPVGTGPFKFKMWKEGEKLVLLKNENYFEKDKAGNRLPYLDAVSISFVKDRQSAFLEFVKGNFDFLSGVDGSFKDDLLTRNGDMNPKYVGKFQIRKFPYLKTDYLGILVDDKLEIVKKSPLRLKAIRQAINYGFDRQKMITYLKNNIGKPATSGFIPYGMPSFDEKAVPGYSFDRDKAKKLLEQAGFPNGKNLPEIVLATTTMYQDQCEFIQSELKEIGMDIKIDVVSSATHSEMVARSAVPFFRKSWIADYPDAENYLAPFYSKNFSPAGPNYTHFKNSNFDKLYEKAQSEQDENVRYEYYKQMDKMIMDEAPVVPLYYEEAVIFYQNYISGLSQNPLNLLVLKNVKKEIKQE